MKVLSLICHLSDYGVYSLLIVLISNTVALYKCKSVPVLAYSGPGMIKIGFTSERATGVLLYGYVALKM